jgi:polar amino acid transport system ATP-binding protein
MIGASLLGFPFSVVSGSLILVTHEIGFARRAGDRVVVLCDGRILKEGRSADVLDRPSTERTGIFLKHVMG